jgi:hypothetical protein
MTPFEDVLNEFYSGEVAGEAIYSTLVSHFTGPQQRLKLASLLQLETEAKAWLRPHLVRRGMDITETAADRERGASLAAPILGMNWADFMKALAGVVGSALAPRFQAFLDEAQSRGDETEISVCAYMLEHEKVQGELARRDLAGEPVVRVVAPLAPLLRYPLDTA